MAGRRTNLALLAVVPAAFLSGALAFAVGSGWGRWAAVAHGVAGLGVVVLAPWKSVVVRRGLRRRRNGAVPSVALGVLVVAALASGVAHSTGLATDLGPVSAMQLHVAAALAALPLFAVHLGAARQWPRPTDLSRRQFLRAGALAGASAVAFAAVEGGMRLASLPGGRRRFTGSHQRGSFDPAAMPVTQWLDDDVPAVDVSTWRLVVHDGGGERSWSYGELLAFDDRARATLDCTGGWWSTHDWSGVRLSRLVGAEPEGRSIVVRSSTGYARRLPAGDAGRLLLATRLDGQPLGPGHGFPARLVAPGRRGFWWVKWVTRIDVVDAPWWLQPPFPLR